MADAPVASDAYGPLDRLLHRLAFAHPALQRVLGDVEDDLFRKALDGVRAERPVFVTGLPRAGTTLLLELLHGTGEFASFTYRQMPFVLSPLLWHRLSARAQRRESARERAHGDRMLIDHDSPEAFEEVLWLNRLGDRLFVDGGMRTLDAGDLDEAFRTAFRRLAGKLVRLARERDEAGPGPAPRYLSKNNANIARLPAITSVFDDATLLCCFRDPAAHVASLHTQHHRFLAMHDDDAFARRYMAWIGHHDFGANFRPIRFDGAIEEPATEPVFWLRYWIDAYRHALESAPNGTRFVSFDALLADGEAGLERLAADVGLARPEALVEKASTLRAPTSAPLALESVSAALAAEATRVHERLRERAAGS